MQIKYIEFVDGRLEVAIGASEEGDTVSELFRVCHSALDVYNATNYVQFELVADEGACNVVIVRAGRWSETKALLADLEEEDSLAYEEEDISLYEAITNSLGEVDAAVLGIAIVAVIDMMFEAEGDACIELGIKPRGEFEGARILAYTGDWPYTG